MAPGAPAVFSQTAQYALQAMIYLASRTDGVPVLGQEISETVGIPQNYLSKIMHTLGHVGLVVAKRGKTGGYLLASDPGDIRIRSAIEAFDNLESLKYCVLGRMECSEESPCTAHEGWKEIVTLLNEFIENTTIADLAQSADDHTASV